SRASSSRRWQISNKNLRTAKMTRRRWHWCMKCNFSPNCWLLQTSLEKNCWTI
ncbi:uncharacterized protein METZ01_LOCUS500206, partial [marine metagenome]